MLWWNDFRRTCFVKVFLSSFFSVKQFYVIFIVKQIFYNEIHTHHINWDINISSSLRFLLKVWFDTDIKIKCKNIIPMPQILIVHILVYILIYLRNNTFFYCAMTFYIPFKLFKSNRVWFEKYRSGISFVS